MQRASSKYIIPYIPDLLLRQTSGAKNLGRDKVIEGSLLFADLSGFTAMSEKLASMGRMGGEKLAEIMNDCFNSLLGRVFASGGDVIKFGGDAFLAYFDSEDSVNRAYLCSANLIRWISENGQISTPVGDFALGIHTGIACGEIYNLVIGSNRFEHLFCGETVENCYAAADAAELGELALTSEAAKRLNFQNLRKSPDGYYICNNFEDAGRIESAQRGSFENAQGNDKIRDFLITGLENQLHFNNGIIEGEHRVLTNLFISVNSLRKNLEADLEKSIEPINSYFTTINEIIDRHGGAFARLDSSGSSEKMLVFFGAPVSTGRDSENCLKAVLEIETALKELNREFVHPLKHRYGINTGLCFVGDVGGASRREYTAMGDAINLAARLMGKAQYGETIVGEDTLKVCGERFEVKEGDLVSVKGKAKPIRLNYLVKEKAIDNGAELIIGRETELARAREFLKHAGQDIYAAMMISGEPGAGKSLLTGRIKKIATEGGLKCIEGDCFRHSQNTPFIPLKAILHGLLDLSNRSTQKQKKNELSDILKAIGEYEWMPLIAPLLDFYPTVPPQLRNLPEDIKRKKINDILIGIFSHINRNTRVLLIIEDIQWVDDASYNIIKTALGSDDTPGILFISRPGKIFDELKNLDNVESIELKGLTSDDSRKLYLTILDGIVPDEDNINQVIEKSGGNPFYLEEMAKAYKELGADKFSSGENIPTGIESVITARIDNLGEMVKKTVRTASVIGRVFSYNVLKEIFPDANRKAKLREYLDELSHLNLTPLERTQPILEYIFKHILTQEVAYNGLSFSSRQALHLQTAEFFAQRKRYFKHEPELPGRHYLLAGKADKALPFIFMAGEKAASEFANTEAMEFYGKAIEIAEELGNREYLLKAIQSRGELAKHTGDMKLAESDYQKLIELGGDDLKLRVLALKKISEINRLVAEYEKAEAAIDELEEIVPDDIPTKVFCLNGRGEITRRRGNLQECRDFQLQALELCDKYDVDPEMTAILYNNLGICHWGMGKMKESAEFYKSAQKLYRQLKDLSGQSKVTNNLGIISDELGKLHQAAKSYEKAERIFKRIGATRMQAFACANLGTNLLTRGYLGQAEEKLKEAKSIFEKIGDHHSIAYAFGDLGHLYSKIGDSDKSIEFLDKALAKGVELKDEEFVIESRLRLARMNFFSGRKSDSNLDELLDKARKIGSAELEIKTLILSGMFDMLEGRYDIARKKITTTKNLEGLADYPELKIELAKLEIPCFYLQGETDRAIKLSNSFLKAAIKGDLAIIGIELLLLASGIGLAEEVDKKLASKVRVFYSRVENDLDEANFRRFKTNQKRLEDFVSSYKHILAKSNPNSVSKVLD